MENANTSHRTQNNPFFQAARAPAQPNLLPSSSPAFSTPIHPIRAPQHTGLSKPSILPILLPPATLRPLAFRTLTKKHDLTLTSSALQLFATFIGKNCGSGWREEGLAEKLLDEVAKSWKKNGGSVIVSGEGEELQNTLLNIETTMGEGKFSVQCGLVRSNSSVLGGLGGNGTTFGTSASGMGREDSQTTLGVSSLGVVNEDSIRDTMDPRQWLKIVGAFDQPSLVYNVNQKHFETSDTVPSLFSDSPRKTHLFRHRYNLIHQRLLRNESFQTSSVATARTKPLQGSSSRSATIQQAYKLTPIANLLGRSGSNHLLLGLLTTSPMGTLTLNDLTGSIGLDIQHARPIPEDDAWFTPGMVVLIDGIYEEEGSNSGPGLDGHRGVGGTLGGKFIAFSIGGPPCERRELTLGTSGQGKDGLPNAGGGFGWVDFLGVGSQRATGSAMRRLESEVLKRRAADTFGDGRGRIIILGDVHLDSARVMQALRKIFGLYATNQADHTPMAVVLMGNFVRHAILTGSGSAGSIEYKEHFNSLAAALSDYPTILQSTTFIFIPGDNDPWASAFSAGAATILPRGAIPDIFTSRIKRAFATVNPGAEKTAGKTTGGEAVWSTNPSRVTLFGPTQEIVLFRDDISGRLRRKSVKFRPLGTESVEDEGTILEETQDRNSVAVEHGKDLSMSVEIDAAVETAESSVPAPKMDEAASSAVPTDLKTARRLVKTILDQGYLSPFPVSDRPVLWDYSGSLQLYPLPTALVLMDPEAPSFAITYEGCHVMNPGPLIPPGKRSVAQWMEYDATARRGKTREIRL